MKLSILVVFTTAIAVSAVTVPKIPEIEGQKFELYCHRMKLFD